MRILLATLPVASPYYPPLGVPSLVAYLRNYSTHECHAVDLSIESFRHVLSPHFLAECQATLRQRIGILTGLTSLSPEEQAQYVRLCRPLVRSAATISSIDAAIQTFTSGALFADPDRRRQAVRDLDSALELVSGAYDPYDVSTSELTAGDAPYALEAVVDVLNGASSPFRSFIEARLATLLEVHAPQVVGLSLNYYSQLLPTLEAARFLKVRHPSVTTIVGGGLTPELGALLTTHEELGCGIDLVVSYEGESALVALLDRLDAGATVRSLREDPTPNLTIRSVPSASVPLRHREDLSAIPPPDFSDLDLKKYLSPSPVLPILTSRGCYWGACAFCTHFHTYGADYRTHDGETVAQGIGHLADRYSCRHFYIVDESLAPSKARAISTALLARGVDVSWGTELRFERALTSELLALMKDAGCRVLSFGLESGSQRVLDSMDKGILVGDVHRILDDLAANKIAAHVMCIVGFPGETREDVDETLDVIRRHRDHLALVGFSPFTLNLNSVIHRAPDRFALTLRPTADPLRPDLNFVAHSGLSQSQSAALYREIDQSPLIAAIDKRAAVATREHLLFDESRRVDFTAAAVPAPAPFVADVDSAYATPGAVSMCPLPFSLVAAQAGREWHTLSRRARLIGSPQPTPPSHLSRCDVFAVHVASDDRILELSSSVAKLLTLCRGGSTAHRLHEVLWGARHGAADASAAALTSLLNRLTDLGLLEVRNMEAPRETEESLVESHLDSRPAL